MDFNQKFSNFIWDFDGTLFDTYPIYTQSLQEAIFQLSQHKLAKKAIERVIRGSSIHEGIAYFAQQLELSEAKIRRLYQPLVNQRLINARPFAGAQLVLKQIKNHHGSNFLITHNDKMALTLLNRFELETAFTDFVLKTSGFKRKPSPESLNYLLTKYQLKKEQTCYIGDRSLDIQAAHNAQISGIFFAPNDLVTVFEADLKITNLIALLDYLK